MKKNIALSLFLLVFVFYFVPNAFAQTQTGNIVGQVMDEKGTPLPGVSVTIFSEALIAGKQSTVTTESGNFRFIALPPGKYDITFSLQGFKPVERKGISITANFVATINVQLYPETLAEEVTVTAAAPVVDTKSTVLATNIDRNLLEKIPSGRDIWTVVEQAPGIIPDRFNIGGTESAQQSSLSVHGATGQQQFSVNGLTLNWPGSNGAWTSFYFDHDSFEEVQIITGGAPAEVSVGGVYMNLITKSGGNTLHGATTILYEPGKLQGNNVTPELKAKGIDKANPVDVIFDFNANLGGPIKKDKIWFFTSYRYYVINTQILGMKRPDGSPEVDVNHQSNFLAKITAELNPKNKFMLQYLFNYQNRFYRREGYAFIEEKASWRQIEPCHIIQGQWTSFLSDNLYLDVRYGYKHLKFPLSYQPSVKPTDYARVDDVKSTLTGAAEYDFTNIATRHQVNASLSYYVDKLLGGTHDIKLGFEYARALNAYTFKCNGDMVMHFLDGVPSYVIVWNTPVDQKSMFQVLSIYAQDSYTIGRRLTFNLGARFEAFEGWNPAQSSPGGNFYGPRSFPEKRDIPNWKDIVPRFGITYDLFGNGKTAIKFTLCRYLQSEGTRFPEALNPNAFGGDLRLWDDKNGDLTAQKNELSEPLFVFGGVGVRLDPNCSRPYSDEVTIGLDHELFKDVAVSAYYYYRKNKNLLGRINEAISASDFTPVSVITPEGKSITVYNLKADKVGLVDRVITNIPEFYETYNGLEITIKKRLSNNWQMMAGYTRGSAKGYNLFTVWGFVDCNDPNNIINEKDAYMANDCTNIFKLVGTYIFPYDIALSANFRYYTGFPITKLYTVTGLNQGPITISVERRGTSRYPNVAILDLSLSKALSLGRIKAELIFNVFNALNASTTISMVTMVGPYYGTPSKILSPIIGSLGLRARF
jgi:hypothetical protein